MHNIFDSQRTTHHQALAIKWNNASEVYRREFQRAQASMPVARPAIVYCQPLLGTTRTVNASPRQQNHNRGSHGQPNNSKASHSLQGHIKTLVRTVAYLEHVSISLHVMRHIEVFQVQVDVFEEKERLQILLEHLQANDDQILRRVLWNLLTITWLQQTRTANRTGRVFGIRLEWDNTGKCFTSV